MTTSSTRTTPAASAESRIPGLPPIDCTGWCDSEDGHATAHHVEDQFCSTQVDRIPLTAEKLISYGNGVYGLGCVDAFMLREAYSTRTLFRVVHNEDGKDGCITMTRDEATALRDALDKALAADELDRS